MKILEILRQLNKKKNEINIDISRFFEDENIRNQRQLNKKKNEILILIFVDFLKMKILEIKDN